MAGGMLVQFVNESKLGLPGGQWLEVLLLSAEL